jgi:hypothetical protein
VAEGAGSARSRTVGFQEPAYILALVHARNLSPAARAAKDR